MTFYARINNQNELRTDILEAAREPLLILKAESEINEIREKKHAIMKDLKEELTNLLSAVKNFDDLLPEKKAVEEMQKHKEALEKKREEEEEKEMKAAEKKVVHKKKKVPVQTEVKTVIREIGPDEPEKKVISKPEPKTAPAKHEPELKHVDSATADMDRLEYTLQKIEQKLAQLKD